MDDFALLVFYLFVDFFSLLLTVRALNVYSNYLECLVRIYSISGYCYPHPFLETIYYASISGAWASPLICFALVSGISSATTVKILVSLSKIEKRGIGYSFRRSSWIPDRNAKVITSWCHTVASPIASPSAQLYLWEDRSLRYAVTTGFVLLSIGGGKPPFIVSPSVVSILDTCLHCKMRDLLSSKLVEWSNIVAHYSECILEVFCVQCVIMMAFRLKSNVDQALTCAWARMTRVKTATTEEATTITMYSTYFFLVLHVLLQIKPFLAYRNSANKHIALNVQNRALRLSEGQISEELSRLQKTFRSVNLKKQDDKKKAGNVRLPATWLKEIRLRAIDSDAAATVTEPVHRYGGTMSSREGTPTAFEFDDAASYTSDTTAPSDIEDEPIINANAGNVIISNTKFIDLSRLSDNVDNSDDSNNSFCNSGDAVSNIRSTDVYAGIEAVADPPTLMEVPLMPSKKMLAPHKRLDVSPFHLFREAKKQISWGDKAHMRTCVSDEID